MKPTLTLACSVMLVGCVNRLPGPAAPPQEMPQVSASLGPIAPGRQWVILDTPNDHARVTRIVGTTSSTDGDGNTSTSDVTKEVCVTPCARDLRVADHRLLFQSITNSNQHDEVDVHLGGGDPMVMRHIPEVSHNNAVTVVGAVMAVGGLAGGLGAGIPMVVIDGPTARQVAGGSILVGGILLLLGGAIVAGVSHDVTEGATTTWTVPGTSTPRAPTSSGPPTLLRF